MPAPPTATVVVPTRRRPQYLQVTLASVKQQVSEAGAGLLVVADGPDPATAEVARRFDAQLIELPEPRGANAARNAAIAAISTDVVVFIDDDVKAPPGWLAAILAGVRSAPDHDVFGGPIRARLEGGGPRACGREPAPITTLDLGPHDRDVRFVWSANMAVRTRAFERVGRFDETIFVRGDEEDWQRRYAAQGGRIRYLAAAGLVHRRTTADSTITKLTRSAFGHGRAARRYDTLKGTAPTMRQEVARPGGLWMAHAQATVRVRDRDGCAGRGSPARGPRAKQAERPRAPRRRPATTFSPAPAARSQASG